VITAGNPLVLVLQYCEHGSVLQHLKKKFAAGEAVDIPHKLAMASEIAAGMEHLVQNRFIHRDLAARNVLLAAGGTKSGLVSKVADFGLSRGANNESSPETEDYYKSSSGVFPVRWTSPEAMETLKFSPASDVWSFGIVVIELLQDGETPYHGMPNPEVMKMTISGDRHLQPPGCSDKVYQVLLACWNHDPKQRPSFGHLRNQFSEFAAPETATRKGSTFKVGKSADGGARPDEWESAGNTYSGFDDFIEEGTSPAAGSNSSGTSALRINPVYNGDDEEAGSADTAGATSGPETKQAGRQLSQWEESAEVLEGMTL